MGRIRYGIISTIILALSHWLSLRRQPFLVDSETFGCISTSPFEAYKMLRIMVEFFFFNLVHPNE